MVLVKKNGNGTTVMNTEDSKKELQFRRTVLVVLLLLGIWSSLIISPWMLLMMNFIAGIIAVARAFMIKAEITKKSVFVQVAISIIAIIFGFLALFIVCLPDEG